MSEHQNNHDAARHEKTDVDVKSITLITIVSVVILIISLVLIEDVFVLWVENDKSEYVYSVESAKLQEVRAAELEKLSSYGVVDSAKSVYRVPIDHAMQIVAEEASAE